VNLKSEKLSDLLNMAEVEIDGEAEKKEEALEELKQHVTDLHEEDDPAKRREAATTVRMLAKENFRLKVLFGYEDVDVEGHMIG
jgi:DNA-binding NarL/FixJ family response regulator